VLGLLACQIYYVLPDFDGTGWLIIFALAVFSSTDLLSGLPAHQIFPVASFVINPFIGASFTRTLFVSQARRIPEIPINLGNVLFCEKVVLTPIGPAFIHGPCYLSDHSLRSLSLMPIITMLSACRSRPPHLPLSSPHRLS
jgi:hypothetical protein